jgi:biotin carboxyl carrier protein
MRLRTSIAGCLLAGAALAAVPAPASASAAAGGTEAPDGSGGTTYGAPLARIARRPVATAFQVSPRAVEQGGAPPQIALRIDQRGVPLVNARIVFWPLGRKGRVLRIDLGAIPTGRLLNPSWPAGSALVKGRYVVRIHATAPGGGTLLRRATTSGRTGLTVKAPAVAPALPPAPAQALTPTPAPAPVTPVMPAVPAPAPTPGIFPVQGPHTFGGADAQFGAQRTGHMHEGQDVVAAEGQPIVAPVAGTIVKRAYQAGGAGYYLVQDTPDGRSFFFAHCQKDSFAVEEGQAVAAGQPLCAVGHTGAASGPHLHFEIWVGGWRRSAASAPVDPLAQLQAWDV